MGYNEFIRWVAYYQAEPFGELREDIRAAQLMALIANTNRDPEKRPEPYALDDFLFDYWQTEDERSDEMHSTHMLQKMQAFAAQVNRQHGINPRDARDQDRR